MDRIGRWADALAVKLFVAGFSLVIVAAIAYNFGANWLAWAALCALLPVMALIVVGIGYYASKNIL